MEPRTPAESASAADAHTYLTYRMPLPRLTLTPGVGHGPLHGAWWPRCDALELELPSLLGSLGPGWGSPMRVTVDPADWPDAPNTVMAPGRVIAVEPAGPGSEAHLLTVDCAGVGRWVLLVVPPEETAGNAARLLAAAADPENPLTAARMLTLSETGPLVGTDGDAE
ncbi:DUF5994 family protein [Streptomyces cavernae]|uniref:DUF5994 family protein n=1 Tax=Streptomyces cavernae TaxID=2259034 RepID=UPI001EE3D4A0|nr:DUF5994 family protein [Streptomyces cavernae]